MKNSILGLMFLCSLSCSARGGPRLGMPYKSGDWDNDVPGFTQGKFYFSAGIGTVNLNYVLASKLKNSIAPNWKHVTIDKRNTWYGKAEYAITPHLGLGLDLAYSGLDVNVSMDSVTSLNIPISGKLSYRTWSALARVNYHILEENNFDFYLGLGIGYRANNLSVTSNDTKTDRWNFPVDLGFITKRIPHTLRVPTIGGDLTLGMRYHILPPVAIYAELGLAKTFLQVGVTVRI